VHLDVTVDKGGKLERISVGTNVPWNRAQWHAQVGEWVEDRKIERMGPEAVMIRQLEKRGAR
jgi:hypothetical protein